MTKDETRKAVFVTDDKWLLNNGVLDEIDIEMLKEASPDGKPFMMNTKQMFEQMQKQEPARFERFRSELEKTGPGITIDSVDQLVALVQAADKRYGAIEVTIECMTVDQARLIRKLRVDMRHTWRSVAREVYKWKVFSEWQPPSNQIAGMCLCDKAAKLLGEKYREEPWN